MSMSRILMHVAALVAYLGVTKVADTSVSEDKHVC
jgi:hypothetical protein